jgi:uncharacterized membrane protein YbhN (UPF0104 family)
MKMNWKRILRIAIIGLGVFFIGRFGLRFPWKGTAAAFLETDMAILSIAVIVNLSSLVAKGWAWHLLLKPLARNRWRSAQEANWIGATVNCLSVSLAGEAVRVQQIARRDEVPLTAAVSSVVGERAVEGIALGMFLVLTAIFIPLPHVFMSFRLGAIVLLAAFVALALFYRPRKFPAQLPSFFRTMLSSLAKIGTLRHVLLPLGLTLFNWFAQWMTFHLVLVATHSHPSLASSLVALLATNLAGFLRLTPSNIGIFQASMVLSLAPLGYSTTMALTASLVLQAIQIFPVVAAGLWLLGWRRYKDGRTKSQAIAEEGVSSDRILSTIV